MHMHFMLSLRRRDTWRIACVAWLFSVLPGCFALAGYGEEVGQADVTVDAPFELAFDAKGHRPKLWLKYDVAFAGSDFTISGPFEAAVDGAAVGEWNLQLRKDDPPIVGTSSRFEIGSMRMTGGDRSSASGTIFLATLDEVSKGQHVVVAGQWRASSASELTTLRLVATN